MHKAIDVTKIFIQSSALPRNALKFCNINSYYVSKKFWNLMYKVISIMYQDFQFLTHKIIKLPTTIELQSEINDLVNACNIQG